MESKRNISGISDNLSESIIRLSGSDRMKIEKSIFHGKRIAISVSENEDLEFLGLSENHIKDTSIEIARYLFVNGATLLYGGDLRLGGYTELFLELSNQYKYLFDKEFRFVNYIPFPNARKLSTADIVKFRKKQVEAKILDTPEQFNNPDPQKNYDPIHNVEDKFLYAECLSDMRKKMTVESDARIVLGGRYKDFIGYFPGIVEEVYHSLNQGKATYLLGGFGGATKSIIEIISGQKSPRLTNDYQFDTQFLRDFKNYASGRSEVILNYDFVFDFFKRHSVDSISNLNGLTNEENLILFESTNIHELIFLIIRGLQNILCN